MRLIKTIATALVLSPMFVAAQDQEVVVITQASGPATSQIGDAGSISMPAKGMNKASVSRAFGTPQVRHPAVGGGSRQQPPITRWDYPGFSVFFEYDHVVDAVQADNPAPIAVRDGLAGGPR